MKPEVTVTLARPMGSSTVRTTLVVGSRTAISSAGHTIPIHWPCNIDATGMYVSVWEFTCQGGHAQHRAQLEHPQE